MKKINSFKDFTELFPDNDACRAHLVAQKWKDGYECNHCKHTVAVKGKTWYYKRCQACGYDESCTAHSLFHKIKFPLVSAFWIIYQLTTMKKGMSTHEIGRQYGVHQVTAWFFKHKVQRALSEDFETFINEAMHSNRKKPEPPTDTQQESAGCDTTQHEDSKAHQAEAPQKCRHAQCRIINCIGNASNPSVAKDVDRSEIKKSSLFVMRKWLEGTHHKVSENHLKWYLMEFKAKKENTLSKTRQLKKVIFAFIKLPHTPYKTVIAT